MSEEFSVWLVYGLQAGGLIFFSVLFWNTVTCPFRQRDEARSALRHLADLPPLADRLDELAKEIGGFSRDFQLSRPSANDHLNYVSPSMRDKVDMGGQSNMVIGSDADEFQVRMIRNAQNERMNHEIAHLDKFHTKHGGMALSRLRKAAEIGAISKDTFAKFESAMQQNYLGNADALFKMAQGLCEEAAVSLREMENS
ncbi:MAG: hypothetical protein RID62_02775 [Roseovarius sp.]|uniref:hypothetical protein n=1 Tax=Roseovarius sp. TaxID=1486281 RepID=UPI0032F00BF8